MRSRLPLLALPLALAACASAQTGPVGVRTLADDDWCAEAGRSAGYGSQPAVACEVREVLLPAGRLGVTGTNGGIKVRQWDRPDVLVRARVVGRAQSEGAAERLVGQTRVEVDDRDVRAVAPRTRDGSVSVGYEVFAPRRTDLALRTQNGGLSVEGIEGTLVARTQNGGIVLRDVAGDVVARTTNGGVQVGLGGSGWRGSGLDAETTNGGIQITVPRGYSADLEASTETGRIATSGLDLRGTERERGRYVGDRVEGRIGEGGPRLSARTTNGGITIRRAR
jgi:DUF4097 and DUF4098 domain-containing protein YvlB